MIYTVTFNPSLDYVIGAEKLEPGKINRTTRENIYPGGKGNNVSVVLSNLGHKSKALGFVSGFTGAALEKMLDDFGCYTDFIQLDNGFTRINVKSTPVKRRKSTVRDQGSVKRPSESFTKNWMH